MPKNKTTFVCLESIQTKPENENGKGEGLHNCYLSVTHEGNHRCSCGYEWSDEEVTECQE